MKVQGSRIAKTMLKKKKKLRKLTLSHFELITKLQYSRHCVSSIRLDIWVSGIELRVEK